MQRVCGALEQRTAWHRSRCWCGGLFCGRGGLRMSARFRKDTHGRSVARSREEFETIIAQVDLFSGQAVRDEWIARLPASKKPGTVTHGRRFL